MSNFSQLSVGQGQAFLNEFKGNIFEFQVGQNLAQLYGCSSQFLNDIGENQLQQLYLYEKSARAIDKTLGKKLHDLSVVISKELKSRFESANAVYIVGKSFSGTGDDSLNEADIIIKQSEVIYPISLKLCKNNSYVNTKSGGCRSFLSSYFQHSIANVLQEEFNSFLDEKFNDFATKLYERHSLQWQGKFDKQWKGLDIGDLPSQLNEEDRSELHFLYYELKVQLHKCFLKLFESDLNLFLEGFKHLCGFSNERMTQVKCFHKDHEFEGLDILSANKLTNLAKDFQFIPLEETSSFSINLQKYILQIRIKPMNKFIQPSFKVNCSMKLINDN